MVNVLSESKGTPPHFAVGCFRGDEAKKKVAEYSKTMETANLLLENGADVNLTTSDAILPLHVAVSNKNVSLVKLLLDSGVNPNVI